MKLSLRRANTLTDEAALVRTSSDVKVRTSSDVKVRTSSDVKVRTSSDVKVRTSRKMIISRKNSYLFLRTFFASEKPNSLN